jgi:sugar O-acyltransferase (sialic acid O-acetyltransferase NeuD family)
VLIEALQLMGVHELVGLLDPDPALWNTKVLGVPVLGDDGVLVGLREQGVEHFFIGLGGTGDNRPRMRLYETALGEGYHSIKAIHPQAVISTSAQLGNGLMVMAGTVINAAAILGDNVIVNTGAIVEHDCVLGDHVHVATGARLASTVIVGREAHIGAGSTVRQGITIGEGAIVGAGSVVVSNVEPGAVVVGVPARVLKYRETVTVDSSLSHQSSPAPEPISEEATQ